MVFLFAIMLLGGLWLAGQRPSAGQLRWSAMAFTLGVAAYAVISKVMEIPPAKVGEITHFGFFPNRNHTATYLAMGAICGLGNILQAQRDKRYVSMAVALLGTGICLWAVAGWSVSRGGILLSAVGTLLWLPILGTRYLGKNGIRAMALLGLTVVGGFLVADTNVKQRLSKSVEQAGDVLTESDSSLSISDTNPVGESIQNLDFRIPTALDTLDLIREHPWTGIGAGQYSYVFPQYRKMAAVANDSDNLHPESDWLWMASETGVPSALSLAILVGLAIWKSLVGIHHGRDRALRAGCLAAALLVPIHGLFDVPGHRISLAWSSAFLFSLSLQSSCADATFRQPLKWPSRLIAICFIVTGFWLMRAQWWGGSQPATIAAKVAGEHARDLYRQDLMLEDLAHAKGEIHQPPPQEDLVEKALSLLEPIDQIAPLDRSILRLKSSLALQFDDKYALVTKSFAIERALDPMWVAAPLRQAEALAPVDQNSAAALFQEALRRAAQIDQFKPGTIWSRTKTLDQIKKKTSAYPELRRLIAPP